MASNPVIQSISDELDSLLDAIHSFELTSSAPSSRTSSRNHALIAEEDAKDFTPVILRNKHSSNASDYSNQDNDLQAKDEEKVNSHLYDTIPDQAKVTKALNQILQARFSPINVMKEKPVKPIRPARKDELESSKVGAKDENFDDDPLPPPPVDFLMDALAAKLSERVTPNTTPKASPAHSPRGSPKPPPRAIPPRPAVGRKPKEGDSTEGYINLGIGTPKPVTPKSKPRHIKLMIEPEDGNMVKYVQLKMVAVTGSDNNLIGKLLASSYVLEAKPDAASTVPRVVQSKSSEVQIGDAISVKIEDATSLEEIKEQLAVLASTIKSKLEARGYDLYDWRSDSKPYDAKIGYGSWDGIIAFEKILMHKKVIKDATADANFDEWNYFISA